jgi:hypothetical protein
VSKKAISAVTIVAGIIGLIIGKVGVQSYFDHRRATAFDRALAETSSQMNGKLPMKVDQYTRLDSTMPGPGKRLTYMYTLLSFPPGVAPAEFASALRPSIVNSCKTSPQFATFREQGVELHYVYRDTAGKHVGEIIVSPDDYR